MKKLTLKWLEEKRACYEGKEWFKEQSEKEPINIINNLISYNEKEKLQWANWLIVRLMNKKQKVQYAIFAAEQVIDFFEKKYSEDKRPRKAIEAAKKYLKNPCEKTKNAAAYAATAAATAAAYAAAYAADAAYAAAAAAYAAAAAAYAAAAAAAYAAYAYNKMIINILNFGKNILKI